MIRIEPDAWREMVAHAHATYPNECCGAMLGAIDDGQKTVRIALPLENAYAGAHGRCPGGGVHGLREWGIGRDHGGAGRRTCAILVAREGADVCLVVGEVLEVRRRHDRRELVAQPLRVCAADPEGYEGRAVSEDGGRSFLRQALYPLGSQGEEQPVLPAFGQDGFEVPDEALRLLDVEDVR